MKENENVFALTGDLGYIGFNQIQKDFPDRFVNCGASEQTMLDIAVGLAYEDKIPFCYTISPFFYRAFETIRTYIDYEHLNVKLIGSGRYKDYKHDGYSHDATDIAGHLKMLFAIREKWPETKEEIPLIIKEMCESDQPYFLSLRR